MYYAPTLTPSLTSTSVPTSSASPPISQSSLLTVRRKPQAENWDDDFEFSLPTKSKPQRTSLSVSTTTRRSASGLEDISLEPATLRANEAPTNSIPAPPFFSPGFHLPSQFPNSPYRAVIATSSSSILKEGTELPVSSSFPALPYTTSESEVETETEQEDGRKTPRRKRKARPVSALSPRPKNAWSGEEWSRVNKSSPVPPVPAVPAAHIHAVKSASSTPSASSHRSTQSVGAVSVSPPVTQSFSATTQSTLRRLGSLSKKHGRRLSGGWKFGSSSSSIDSKRPEFALETVTGSPTKVTQKPLDRAHGSDSQSQQVGVKATHATTSNSDANEDGKEGQQKSFNNFIIPRDVMAKQKELKEGIGAVKKFAGGVKSLKVLLDAHDQLRTEILFNGSETTSSLFSSLEDEYAQWWEMATVLIEVGSTGAAESRSSSYMTPTPSPAESRRITLASQDAKAAADGALRLTSSSTLGSFTDSFSSRQMSLPTPSHKSTYPSDGTGPPLASPTPETWRASTGRQELSKRQLEVLRSMLGTPVQSSESLGQSESQVGSISASSGRSESGSLRPPTLSRGMKPSISATRHLDTSNATSYQLGTSEQSEKPKQRQVSRAGLAGLRDLLKSLKQKPSAPQILQTRESSNPSHNSNFCEPLPPAPRVSTSIDAPFPPRCSSSSVLTQTSSQSPLAAQFPRRTPRDSEKTKRPSIRNMFRTSSGNWSELVKASSPSLGSSASINASSVVSAKEEQMSAPPHDVGTPIERRQRPISGVEHVRMPRSATFAALSVGPPPAWTEIVSSTRYNTDDTLNSTIQDGEATLRPKSRMLGLGHPSDPIIPARASSAPLNAVEVPSDEVPRSRSDGGIHSGKSGDEVVVALTPDNLPVLLDYLRQCQRKLEEWRGRAEALRLSDLV